MLHSTVFNTSQLCYQLGVRHAVMSPGSRNAPLTISFARYDDIEKWIIPDERSAGFIALGIAQETKSPVVLCCTSGSALLNYAPAIAEAYYREIPLIVMSADRPPELIDQRDGQTIRQFESLKNHVKDSFQLPIIQNKKEANDYQSSIIEAIRLSTRLPLGPVHINIPFREPFYPSVDDDLSFNPVVFRDQVEDQRSDESRNFDLSNYERPLLLVGQLPVDGELNSMLSILSEKIPVVRSPLNNLGSGIQHVDGFINNQSELKPDLLLTSGLSVLSKKLKHFLRKNSPKKHLHFDAGGVSVDTYKSSPQLIKYSLKDWLKFASFDDLATDFIELWKNYEELTQNAISNFCATATFSEVTTALQALAALPDSSNLHLSNSMSVRYADLFGIKNGVECYANRGTSGIDGCTSTALGTSLVSSKINTLITGDLAFLYDRNAFFHNYRTPNLRIIILNNQGGGIFRLIDGPSALPELEDYFETRHNKTAEYICLENGLEYVTANNERELEFHLSTFYEASSTTKVLEVFTDPETNQQIFKDLKKHINECINN
ncbi:2-succinyl-5-enolpyruvyl-6-hydroxy-3-cyclohexene-1-carboxylic-acid synthase [Ekhidna sp.]